MQFPHNLQRGQVNSNTGAVVNNNVDHTVLGGPSFADSLYRIWAVGIYFTSTADVPGRTRIQFQDTPAGVVYVGFSLVGFDSQYMYFPGGLKGTEDEGIEIRSSSSVASIAFRGFVYYTQEFYNA
jgi:hypothetical protein